MKNSGRKISKYLRYNRTLFCSSVSNEKQRNAHKKEVQELDAELSERLQMQFKGFG